MKNKERKLSEW